MFLIAHFFQKIKKNKDFNFPGLQKSSNAILNVALEGILILCAVGKQHHNS